MQCEIERAGWVQGQRSLPRKHELDHADLRCRLDQRACRKMACRARVPVEGEAVARWLPRARWTNSTPLRLRLCVCAPACARESSVASEKGAECRGSPSHSERTREEIKSNRMCVVVSKRFEFEFADLPCALRMHKLYAYGVQELGTGVVV